MRGYSALVSVADPGGCPVAYASKFGQVGSIARSSVPDLTPIEEFAAIESEGLSKGDGETFTDNHGSTADHGEHPADHGEHPANHDEPSVDNGAWIEWDSLEADPVPIGSSDGQTVYRFERDFEQRCVCEVIERSGVAITDISVEKGILWIGVRVRSLETIGEIVDNLRERFDGVQVRELLKIGDEDRRDPVVVYRDRLTDRQRTVLEAAYDSGYFEYPRETNATELAEELGISRSTFTRHLTVAQSKLLNETLER